jgi:hypothetical protein
MKSAHPCLTLTRPDDWHVHLRDGDSLTATYGITLNMSIATVGNSPAIYNGTGVGLKGGFGAVTICTSYNLNFFTNAIADSTGFAGASVGQLNSSAGGLKGNILTYTAPQFVPGLSLAAEIQRGGNSDAGGNITGYKAQYNNCGLVVRYSNNTKTEVANDVIYALACGNSTCDGDDTTVTASSSNQMTTSSIGGYKAALSARTALDKTKASAIAMTYDFGMAKVFYGSSSIKSSTTVAQVKTNTTGVSVPLGAFNVAYAVSSEKGTSDGTSVASGTTVLVDDAFAAGDTAESKGSRLFVTYALSKRTTLYGYSGKVSMDTYDGGAVTLKTTTTSVGVKHSF